MGGRPKGLEVVGTHRIIDRVAAALLPVTGELMLAANDPEAADWLPGVAVVADRLPGSGGLAGVEAALLAGREALVVAWDMPFVTTALLRLLVDEFRSADADFASPASASPFGMEPFCAVYSTRLLPSLTEYLRRGGGAAGDFLRVVSRSHLVSLEAVRRVGDPARLLFSVNTAEDLARARALAEPPE